jgi:hypothetical protein
MSHDGMLQAIKLRGGQTPPPEDGSAPQGAPVQGTPMQGAQSGAGNIEAEVAQFAQSLTAEEQLAALPLLQQFMQAVQGRESGPSDAELLQGALQPGPAQSMRRG